MDSKAVDHAGLFLPLGYSPDGLHVYIYSARQNQAVRLPASDRGLSGYLGVVAPMAWWEERFSAGGKFSSGRAVEWLRAECIERGLYDPGDVRGLGAYADGDTIVINLGDRLVNTKDNGNIDFCNKFLEYNYQISKKRISLPKSRWSQKDAMNFLRSLSAYGFAEGTDDLVVAGWCAAAPWISVLEKSPHLWITGSSGCGKSHLIDNVIAPAMGQGKLYVQGLPTEAGIRQTLGYDCRPVIIDEFEPGTAKARGQIDAILSLARASYGGSELIKGSQTHDPVNFSTRAPFCVASVQTRLESAANDSRFIKVELTPHKGRYSGPSDFSGLRGVMCSRLDELVQGSLSYHQNLIAEGCSGRAADTWAPILAGAYVLLSGDDAIILDDEFRDFWKNKIDALYERIKGQTDMTSLRTSDEAMLIESLVAYRVRVGHGVDDLSISQALSRLRAAGEPEFYTVDEERISSAMQGCGFRFLERADEYYLAVAISHPSVKRHMSECGFPGFADMMKRCGRGGLRPETEVVRIAKHPTRAVVIPLSLIFQESNMAAPSLLNT